MDSSDETHVGETAQLIPAAVRKQALSGTRVHVAFALMALLLVCVLSATTVLVVD